MVSWKRLTQSALLTAGLTACSENAMQPRTTVDAQLQAGGLQAQGYVLTPAGWFHSSCVHEIPAGARVSVDNVVTRRDGSRYQIPRCAFRAHLTLPHFQGGRAVPADTGWVEDAYASAPQGDAYRSLNATWTVPSAPTHTFQYPEVYFTFPGIWNNAFILQPVLQYGYSKAGPPGYWPPSWGLASWHCDGRSSVCDHSSLISASVHDAIYGEVSASACQGGLCTWTVTTVDLTKGTRTILTKTDYDNYFSATGGAVETHSGFNSCSYFPSAGVFFTNIALSGRSGALTPDWGKAVPQNPSPSCGFDVKFTTTTVSDIHNPPPPLVTGATTNPSPAVQYQPFSLTLTGSGFDPAVVQIVYTLNCDPPSPSCEAEVIPNSGISSKTETQLVVSQMTFGTAGTLYVHARNGDTGPLSGYQTVTIRPLY